MSNRVMKLRSGGFDNETTRVLNWYAQMDRLYNGFREGAIEITKRTGVPLCVEGCGKCCSVSVFAHGIEAEYARSLLLGNPKLIAPVLNACREWLTKPGFYTHGSAVTLELKEKLKPELQRVGQEPCCFLTDDKRCLLHDARPIACRSYGVTHLPNRWCRRPLGMDESENARVLVDSENSAPLRQWRKQLLTSIDLPRFSRQGFFASMLFEALATTEYAGLLYDGKIPLVKTVEFPPGSNDMMIVWQEQFNILADESISHEPALQERNGQLVQVGEVV